MADWNKKKKLKLVNLNRSITWQRKVDDFFNKFEQTRTATGKRFDHLLTIFMVASLILLVLTVIYVVVKNREGPTNWAIQLYDIDIDALTRANQEILVINYKKVSAQSAETETDLSEYFSAVEIARVKASGKQVLAYFPISNFDLNTKQNTVSDDLETVIFAGFDGVYLTGLGSYENCPDASIATCKTENANLVISLASSARKHKNGFLVYVGDGYGVLETEAIWSAIDGVGKENVFFYEGKENSEEEINYHLAILDQVSVAGKMPLVLEYDLKETKHIATLCSQSKLQKLVPGSAPASLNSIDEKKVCK